MNSVNDRCLPLLRNITTKMLCKTTPVTYRPSRLMHWWTRFMIRFITATGQVIWHSFLPKFVVWGYVSMPNNSEKPFVWNRNHMLTDRVNGLAKKFCPKRLYIFRTSLRGMQVGQPTSDVCIKWRPWLNLKRSHFSCCLRAARLLRKSKWWIKTAASIYDKPKG